MNEQLVASLHNANVLVPVSELMIVVIALSLCLLFRFNNMGLLLSYMFAVHMGWLFCQKELLAKSSAMLPYVVGYFVCAASVMLLAIYGMLQSSD